jgi:hypothetical protein
MKNVKRLVKTVGAFLAGASLVVTLGACGDAADDSETSVSSAVGVSAKNCEIFVDRAGAIVGEHGGTRVHFWIKTLNGRLDSQIKEVGFHGLQKWDATGTACDANDCNLKGKWADYVATPFEGASDYFELDFYLTDDFMVHRSFEGAFFVRTQKGTTYWANASSSTNKNFVVDENMFEHLWPLQSAPLFSADPSQSVVVADRFPYLNAGSCR